jgi:hypothetical protein
MAENLSARSWEVVARDSRGVKALYHRVSSPLYFSLSSSACGVGAHLILSTCLRDLRIVRPCHRQEMHRATHYDFPKYLRFADCRECEGHVLDGACAVVFPRDVALHKQIVNVNHAF